MKVSDSKGSYKSVKFIVEASIVKNLTSKFIEMAGGTIWYLVLPIESDDSRSQTYRSSECSKEQNNIETA